MLSLILPARARLHASGSAVARGMPIKKLAERPIGVPLDARWRQGARVQGNMNIAPNTVIATFDSDGRHGNHSDHTSHAAIYLGQDAQGIQVIGQFKEHSADRPLFLYPHKRTLRFGQAHDSISNRGEYFYVVR